ncbi:hypothetical protein ACLOJK_026725 [Asimina triloba]
MMGGPPAVVHSPELDVGGYHPSSPELRGSTPPPGRVVDLLIAGSSDCWPPPVRLDLPSVRHARPDLLPCLAGAHRTSSGKKDGSPSASLARFARPPAAYSSAREEDAAPPYSRRI